MKNMLSFAGLVIFLLALPSVSCKKEKSAKELLIGKWTCTSVEITTFKFNFKDKDDIYPDTTGQSVYEFLNDGTFNIYFQNDLMGTVTWRLTGSYLIATSGDQDTIEYKLSIEDNTMTLTSSFEDNSEKTVICMTFSRV
jgi:hypothetical protein